LSRAGDILARLRLRLHGCGAAAGAGFSAATPKKSAVARVGLHGTIARMVIHELATAECRAAFTRATHGRLACARDDQPYVVPFFFALDAPRDRLYSISALGQKITWMRANPRVCVEVDEFTDRFTWTTVLAFGRYRELGDLIADADDRQRAQALLQQREQWWLPGLGKVASGREPDIAIVYCIEIEHWSGRRAGK
jgi:nitroimidazol reductase NimA-like FMN-containing flavoprotein (pyridoxamine 5'-phosphate oxidase superfamily)